MIDLHCHLLPGIDDGPATMADAIALARAAVEAGTTTIVATPHIDHRFGLTSADVSAGIAALEQALDEAAISVKIRAGGEIALTRVPDLAPHELAALGLGGGPYALIESPHTLAAGDFELVLFELRRRGQAIVLAHPERCPSFQREPERLARLVDAGVLCSITAGSLAGQFGDRVRRFTIELLRAGLVHDIASDAHDATRRSPAIAVDIARADRQLPGLAAQAHWLTHDAPAAILAGEPLPPRPPLSSPRRRRRLAWLRSA